MLHFDSQKLSEIDERFRTNFINSLYGARPAILVATQSTNGNTNLAVFSQVLHLGAKPALCGILFRPDSVSRHTLENIRQTGVFTLNTTTLGMEANVHQTSARYPEGVSEFDACGIESVYISPCQVPFVAQSPVKIALRAQNEIKIEDNGTLLLIGAIEHVFVDDALVSNTGQINHHHAKSLAVVGLDTYVGIIPIARFSYAKPDQSLQKLDL